jgi:hypothetical protein
MMGMDRSARNTFIRRPHYVLCPRDADQTRVGITYVPNPQLNYLTIATNLIVGHVIKVATQPNSDTAVCYYGYLYSCHRHPQALLTFSSQILIERAPSLNVK